MEDGFTDGFATEWQINAEPQRARYAQRVHFGSGPDVLHIVRHPICLRVHAGQAKLSAVRMPSGDREPTYWDSREIRCVDPMRDLDLSS